MHRITSSDFGVIQVMDEPNLLCGMVSKSACGVTLILAVPWILHLTLLFLCVTMVTL